MSQWRQTKHTVLLADSRKSPSCSMIQLDLICKYGHSFGDKLLLHGGGGGGGGGECCQLISTTLSFDLLPSISA